MQIRTKDNKNNKENGMGIYVETFGKVTFDFTGNEITGEKRKEFIEKFAKECEIEIKDLIENEKADFNYGDVNTNIIQRKFEKLNAEDFKEFAGTNVYIIYTTVLEDNGAITENTVTAVKFGKSKVEIVEISVGNNMEYNLENCIRIGWDYWNDNAGEREDVSEINLLQLKNKNSEKIKTGPKGPLYQNQGE
jgi:hypothetical protein